MTWFERLTGFKEENPDQVRQNITLEGEKLTSLVNGRVMACGRLETPSLGELREQVRAVRHGHGPIALREIVADVQDLQEDPQNAGSLFQVASQFNLLEMVSPNVTPEQGVGIYEYDPTQGPACAIACGAGTIYRNYLVPVKGQIGQSATNQIDCLADVGIALGNTTDRLWQMRNGYALATQQGLEEISNRLDALSETERDEFRRLLRIGIHWNVEVTLSDLGHKVSQAYCSALPVAYSDYSASLWENFAQLVLEASYEATICTAILNRIATGNNRVFLTMLGGGAFGNKTDWIISGLDRAINLYRDWDIDIAIVSYSTSKDYIRELVLRFSSQA